MKIDHSVTGKTRILGIIGNPLEHSISPQLHNSISRDRGLDYIYIPFQTGKEHLETVVQALKAVNVAGFNVTIPYKKEIMKFLDSNTKEALLMGAVNTVKNVDGKLQGYNTDAEGFSRSFKEKTGTGFKGKKVFVIGAGGAARAIVVKIALEGAQEIGIINRTVTKAEEMAALVNDNIQANVKVYDTSSPLSAKAFSDSEIVINTTSIGMYPSVENSPLNDNFRFSAGQIVYDAIYNPLKTRFLMDAEEQGCKVVNGLGMLFYQGIFAYEIWTGVKLPEEDLKRYYESFKEILRK